MKKITLLLALMLLMCLPNVAGAWTQEFRNDYAATNAIYLWMDSSSVTFGTTELMGGHSDWTLVLDQLTKQVMTGPAKPANTAGIFVNFTGDRSAPLSFQWAEVQWSGDIYTLLGSGTVGWSGSGWSYDDTFTHGGDITHIPVPASFLLLSTGLVGLGLMGFRRKRRS
jgi:hypothetical protein